MGRRGFTLIGIKIDGGLGNQMWQYAYGRALSVKLGTELKLDFRNYFPGKKLFALQYYDIHAGFLTDADKARLRTIVQDKGVPSMEQPFAEDNLYLVGNWQNPRYLKIAEKQIRNELQLRVYIRDESKLWLKKIKETPQSVSVHIRRGDYLGEKWRGTFVDLLPNYYYEAAEQLQKKYEKIELFIFSNDVAWCHQHLHFKSPCHYVDCNDEVHGFEDLYLMSQCRHHIIANSTFSWWGAWLGQNDDKCVIAPDKYFVRDDGYYREYNRAWLPEGWIRLEN